MVMVDFLWEIAETVPVGLEDLLHAVVTRTAETESCPVPIGVSLTAVDDETMREYNQRFRGIDAVTDVLSFPMIDFPQPSEFSILDMPGAGRDPITGVVFLGDIVICAHRAREQAAAYGHSLQREWAFLTAHSMLHLFGYDHVTETEARRMEEKQELILQTLGLTRFTGDIV